MNRGLVIFDLDGTLFYGANATVAAVQRAFQQMGLRQPERRDVLFHIGKPAHEFHKWLRSLCSAGEASQLVTMVDWYELEFVADKGELYPGVREALAAVRACAGQMAICTNGPQRYVQHIITTQGIQQFFDAVRHWQSESDTKVLMVGDLLRQLGGRPAVVVGDRRDDVEAAQKNGLAAVAVTYGYGSAEELMDAEAAASSPSELPDLIMNLL